MRISDWSSDVCSSDLKTFDQFDQFAALTGMACQYALPALPALVQYGGQPCAQGAAGVLRIEVGRVLDRDPTRTLGKYSSSGHNACPGHVDPGAQIQNTVTRSEEHTSELPSLMR